MRTLVVVCGAAVLLACQPAAPDAPRLLRANRGNGVVSLSWERPFHDGWRSISGYVVRVEPSSATHTLDASARAFEVSGLTNGTPYTFSVAAVNEIGEGAPAIAQATPATLPGAPTAVAATRGNAVVNVTWSAPTATRGAPLTGYILSADIGETTGPSFVVPANPTQVVFPGLQNGTAYTIRVSAVNDVGAGPSASSNLVTPATIPSPPTPVRARAGNSQARISWDSANGNGDAVTSYAVTVTPGGSTMMTATTTLTFPGLTNGQSYNFAVTATNTVGTSAATVSKTVIPGPTPPDCAGALLQNPQTESGAFDINLQGTPTQVYCDMTASGGGWTMVYKLSTQVPGNAETLWLASSPLNDTNPAFLDATPDNAHYFNRILTHYWNTGGLTWDEARVAVFAQGQEKAFVEFNLAGRGRTDWFALAYVTSATWTDLADGQNFFGIAGDWPEQRNWFINHSYTTCSGDLGWLVVNTGGNACIWENSRPPPMRILYAPGTTRTNWTTGAGVAEVMAVFVR
ncbi:MAG: fibronectin type III domain-containing protein [Myxococcaceae bacterium]